MGSEPKRDRRALILEVKAALRGVRAQLPLLNHQVGGRVELRDGDLDCLVLINRYGPLGPGALARLAALHPATMTGARPARTTARCSAGSTRDSTGPQVHGAPQRRLAFWRSSRGRGPPPYRRTVDAPVPAPQESGRCRRCFLATAGRR